MTILYLNISTGLSYGPSIVSSLFFGLFYWATALPAFEVIGFDKNKDVLKFRILFIVFLFLLYFCLSFIILTMSSLFSGGFIEK